MCVYVGARTCACVRPTPSESGITGKPLPPSLEPRDPADGGCQVDCVWSHPCLPRRVQLRQHLLHRGACGQAFVEFEMRWRGFARLARPGLGRPRCNGRQDLLLVDASCAQRATAFSLATPLRWLQAGPAEEDMHTGGPRTGDWRQGGRTGAASDGSVHRAAAEEHEHRAGSLCVRS